MNEDELFQQALSELDTEVPNAEPGVQQPAAAQGSPEASPQEDKSLLQQGADLWKSAGAGIAKAGFETKDFLLGEPAEGDKSELRRGIEQRADELAGESTANSLTMGISQMVTGLIGAGKLMAPLKGAQWFARGGKIAHAGYEIAKGAAAGAVVIDPHEERLSNLVEQFPALQNPVTDYLAAGPEDSAAEGRFKNALESIGADLALVGVVKAIKLMRSGDRAAAKKVISKMANAEKNFRSLHDARITEAARQANQNEFGITFDDIGPKSKSAPVEEAPAAIKANTGDIENIPPGRAADEVADEGFDPKTEPQPDTPVSTEKEVVDEQVGLKEPLDKNGNRVIPTAVREPDVIRTQEVTDEQLDDILKGSQADTKAIEKFGSREAAIEAGHKFDQGTPLPWQKLRGTEDTMAFIRQTANVLKSRYDLAKGGARMGDARVKSLADELGRTFNEEPALIMGQLQEAGQNASQMVSFMEAGMRIGNKMFQETSDLATKIRNGDYTAFAGNKEAAKAELKARLAATIDVMSAANSVLANSGRTLRRARSEFRIKAADLDALKGLDGDRIAIVMEKANGDPSKIMMLANRTWSQKLLDQATFHLTNGLLWLWPTHLVNTTTNAYMLLGRPTEKVFGGAAAKLFAGSPEKASELTSVVRQAKKEYAYTVASLGDGWQAAVEAFKRGDSILSPHNTEYFQKGTVGIGPETLPWKPVKSVLDLAQNAWMAANYRNIVGLPTRVLGSADEFFKTLRYRAVVQARAAVEAEDVGLTGQAFKDYIQKSLNQAIDPATGRALDASALREAQMTSFQQDLDYDTTFGGSVGAALVSARRRAPILSLVLPFVKTPVNVIRYGIKMTPLLNLAQKDFRDALLGKAGAEAQAHAMGQMAIGSMFSMYAAHLVSQGRFTGSGPSDYKMRQELMATGWRPYSFVWTDGEGNRKYFQVGRFDPAGMAMGLIADIMEMKQKDPDVDLMDVIQASGIAVAKNLGEKTFLLNLNSAIEAALDPENLGPRWVGRTAGSMLPGSSLMRGMNPDPYLRDARTMVDNLMRGVPGMSEKLPKKYTWLGEPIETSVGLTGTEKPDVVEAEHNRIIIQSGKGIGKPSPQWEGVDLRDIKLKSGQTAYERFQELGGHLPKGPSLKDTLSKLVRSKAYQNMSDGDSEVRGTRLNALSTATQRYRELARKVLIQQNPELQQYIKARQKAAMGAIVENRKAKREGDPSARALLEALTSQ